MNGTIFAYTSQQMPFESLPLAPLLYLALVGAYLLVLPLGTYFYLQKRWYVASSLERLLMYFLVFLLFPGMMLLAPFLNLRPQQREIEV